MRPTFVFPDFTAPYGESARRPALYVPERCTVRHLQAGISDWSIRCVTTIDTDAELPVFPGYLRWAAAEAEARRAAQVDPHCTESEQLPLKLRQQLNLTVMGSLYVLVDGQIDLFDQEEDERRPVLADCPLFVRHADLRVQNGCVDVAHEVRVRCATGLSEILGCNIMMQWGSVAQSESPQARLLAAWHAAGQEQPLPAER